MTNHRPTAAPSVAFASTDETLPRSSRGFTLPDARSSRGFTLIEVMMALTVLTIGILGIVAMQKATVVANSDAQQVTVATNIARTWLDRLQRDANMWNHPSSINPVSDIGDTTWLSNISTSSGLWFQPQTSTVGLAEGAMFDRTGTDVTSSIVGNAISSDNAVYCAQVRLTWIYPDQLIRAEVRVYWRKHTMGNRAALSGYGLPSSNGICLGTFGQGSTSNAAPMGLDADNFHWVYAVGSIARQAPR
jgi:type IV pilus assembly protein PilV